MRWIVALGLLAWGCGEGSGGEPDGENATGRANGEPCIRLGSANPCRGGLCLPFVAAGDRGVCSEPCDDACAHGGECVRYVHPDVELARVCLVPCVGLTGCGDDVACFGVDELYTCEGSVCSTERNEESWCQPTF